jgi:hypothetical protein
LENEEKNFKGFATGVLIFSNKKRQSLFETIDVEKGGNVTSNF